jgi:hypothetical protein
VAVHASRLSRRMDTLSLSCAEPAVFREMWVWMWGTGWLAGKGGVLVEAHSGQHERPVADRQPTQCEQTPGARLGRAEHRSYGRGERAHERRQQREEGVSLFVLVSALRDTQIVHRVPHCRALHRRAQSTRRSRSRCGGRVARGGRHMGDGAIVVVHQSIECHRQQQHRRPGSRSDGGNSQPHAMWATCTLRARAMADAVDLRGLWSTSVIRGRRWWSKPVGAAVVAGLLLSWVGGALSPLIVFWLVYARCYAMAVGIVTLLAYPYLAPMPSRSALLCNTALPHFAHALNPKP